MSEAVQSAAQAPGTAPAASSQDMARAIEGFRRDVRTLRDAVGEVIVGHEEIVQGVVVALLAGGHVLLEGVPGLGKTMLVRTLAEAIDLSFSRLQFTPDLMPADILGTNIVVEQPDGRRGFEFQHGPIFAHLILADDHFGNGQRIGRFLQQRTLARIGKPVVIERFDDPSGTTPISVNAAYNPQRNNVDITAAIVQPPFYMVETYTGGVYSYAGLDVNAKLQVVTAENTTQVAIANANYVAKRLEGHYPVLYTGQNGMVAHECIVDVRQLKAGSGVEVGDIAKRLMDYGFHAPTISFPVAGTMMIEPTESESQAELDRFCEALIAIRQEIREIEQGKLDKQDNPLKNAPHTAAMVTAAEWPHGYSRERAAFPAPWTKEHKFWPPIRRVNDVHGDRNLVCACPPVDSYA